MSISKACHTGTSPTKVRATNFVAGGILGVVLGSMVGAVAQGETVADLAHQPFTPSQLEWAVVEFNTRLAASVPDVGGVAIRCGQSKPPATVVCRVLRRPEAKQNDIQLQAERARKAFEAYKAYRKLDTLRIEFSS